MVSMTVVDSRSSLLQVHGETRQVQEPQDAGVQAVISGLALPFNIPDDRPGLAIVDGRLREFDYTTFTTDAFNRQLAEADPIARVRLTWQHAMEGGHTSLPVGKVTSIRADDTGLFFTAEITDTGVGEDVAKAIRRGEAREISTMISNEESHFEERDDGAFARVVTRARLWEISPVLWAQFPNTRVTEIRCESCGRGEATDDEPALCAGCRSETAEIGGYCRTCSTFMAEETDASRAEIEVVRRLAYIEGWTAAQRSRYQQTATKER